MSLNYLSPLFGLWLLSRYLALSSSTTDGGNPARGAGAAEALRPSRDRPQLLAGADRTPGQRGRSRTVAGMAPKWQQLEALTDEEIAERFDGAAEHASPGISFWGDMIVLRKNLHAAQALWLTADDTKKLMADMKALTADLKRSAAESTALAGETRDLNAEVTALTRSIRRMTFWLVVLSVAVLIATTVTVVIAANGK
jgi:hypothetical protein